MKIATFGCSFTQGVHPYYYSYSRELAKLNPNCFVDDYSKGGSSLKWSVTQFEKHKTKYDFVIFQVTTPYRFTYVHHSTDLSRFRLQVTDNFSMYNPQIHNHMITCTPTYFRESTPIYNEKDVKKLHQFLYSNLNAGIELTEWKLFVNYMNTRCDLMLFQEEDTRITSNMSNSYSIENILGSEFMNQHYADKYGHLDQQCAVKVAEWINNKIQSGK